MKNAKRKAPRRARTQGKRAENKDRTKERILEAALKLFNKYGVEGTTTKQVSKAAGIAEGTLFNYFKTKEDLALYFFEKETDGLIAWFHGNKALQKAPLREQLFAIIHRQLEDLEPCQTFIGSVFFRALQPSSKLSPLSLESHEFRVKYLRFIRGLLAEAEEKKEIPPVGDLGAYGFGLFYLGVVAHWLNDNSKGKQRTLAIIDQCLNVATGFASREGWAW